MSQKSRVRSPHGVLLQKNQESALEKSWQKGRARVEPATYRAATDCSTTELTPQTWNVHIKFSWCKLGKNDKTPRPGIEPGFPAWQAGILTTILPRNFLLTCIWLHGAMVTRRIPDPKIGGSIPSGVIFFFFLLFYFCYETQNMDAVIAQLGER